MNPMIRMMAVALVSLSLNALVTGCAERMFSCAMDRFCTKAKVGAQMLGEDLRRGEAKTNSIQYLAHGSRRAR